MLTKSLFRENAPLALLGLWYFIFLLCVRFVTLPLAYPHMGMKPMVACLILAAALWIFMESECKAITGGRFEQRTLWRGLDEHRPWTSWWTLVGAIAAAMCLIYSINQLAAAAFAQLEQPPVATKEVRAEGAKAAKPKGAQRLSAG